MNDKFYGIVHPTFTLPILENVKDGDIVPITIDVKNFKGIGSMTCNILFDPLVLGPVAHFDKISIKTANTFIVNPQIACTGFDMGMQLIKDDLINDPDRRKRMNVTGYGDLGKIIIGMYSVPEVSMEDGTLVTIYLKYTNKFKNYSNIQFAWIPNYLYPYPKPTLEQPQLEVTDVLADTIPTSNLILDENGDPVMEKIETPYYDPKTDENKIWISYKPKYENGVDYAKFYIDGRIGPLKEKSAFLPGTSIVNGKIVYGTTTTVLPFTKITATRESDGVVYKSTSDNTGTFSFTLPHDRYKFHVVEGSQGIDWIKGDSSDLELAESYRNRSIPVPDSKRWMVEGILEDWGLENIRQMILNYNPCHSSAGYIGIWNSCTDPSTWPKPWDSFDWDAGD